MMGYSRSFVWVLVGLIAVGFSATSIMAAPPLTSDGAHGQVPSDAGRSKHGTPTATVTPTTTAAPTVEGTPTIQVTSTVVTDASSDGTEEDDVVVGEQRQIEVLARYFGVSEDTVRSLRDKYGFGFGEIQKALRIACIVKISDASTIFDALTTIVGERQNVGWGQLSKAHDLKQDNKGDNFGSLVSGRASTKTVTATVTPSPTGSSTVTPTATVTGKGAKGRGGNGGGKD